MLKKKLFVSMKTPSFCEKFGVQIEIKFYAKGQIKSESVYEIIDFPKYHQNILIDFCPESLFGLGM